jgi:hypothetical protein
MAEFDQVEQMTKVAAEATAAEDYTTAERTLRRLLRLQEADLGLSHPDVANTHNDLGVVCDRLGRPEEAEFLYRRALGIARRTLPPDHTSVAASLENLSKLYRAQGKTEKLAKLSGGGSAVLNTPSSEAGEAVADDLETSAASTDPQNVVKSSQSSHSEPDNSGQTEESLLRKWSTRWVNGFVLLAVGVALLAVWLLVGRNPVVDSAGEDGARISQSPQSSTRDASTSVGEATTTLETDQSESLLSAVITATGSESSRGNPSPSLSSSQSRALESSAAESIGSGGEDDDVSARRSVGTLGSPATLGGPDTVTVVAAEVCSQLATRNDDGNALAEWRCDAVGNQAVPGQLFFYTRIRSPRGTTVAHQWFRNDSLVDSVTLDIGANAGPGYRTYSSHTVSAQERGLWRVELQSLNEAVIHSDEFVVP